MSALRCKEIICESERIASQVFDEKVQAALDAHPQIEVKLLEAVRKAAHQLRQLTDAE